MTTRDPFHGVQDRVTSHLSRLEGEITHYRTSQESADDIKFKQSASAIQRDCDYLAQTNKIVESNTERFPSISVHELQFRKAFVKEVQAKLRSYTYSVQRPKSSNLQIPGQSNDRVPSNTCMKTVRFANDQLNDMQDVILTDMEESLSKLQNISIDISQELIESDKMIGEMDEPVDVA